MKKIIILIILIFSYLNIYSQDKEASAYKFQWGLYTNDTNLIVDYFNLDKIALGFQWGGSLKMSNALHHNIIHGSSFNPNNYDSNFTEDMYVIGQPAVNISDMAFIQYEPTLLTSDYRNFVTRADDPTNAIFGFNHIDGTILDSTQSGNLNYNRLILYQDSMSNYASDSIVLSDITPKDQFFTVNYDYGQIANYDGVHWNITINLRRLDLADDALTDDTVLVIQLPYVSKDTNGVYHNNYINFDYLPKDNIYTEVSEMNYLENRGSALDTVWYNGENPQNKFVITKKMLSNSNDPRDLTISAHFTCYENYNPNKPERIYYNPRFKPGMGGEEELIDSIDVEVKYYGNCDVAIDWIRIENDKAQQVLRGQYDVADRNAISYFVNDILGATKNGVPLYKLHRLYNQDTESRNPTWWGQSRYFNQVTNGLTITRDGLNVPEAYKYYTKAPNRWIGFAFDDDDALMPAPYSVNGYQNTSTMGLKSGYLKFNNYVKYPDTLSSDFEIKMENAWDWSDMTDDTKYAQQIESDVLQARYEKEISNYYYKPVVNKFLFSGDNWYFYDLLFNVVSDTNRIVYVSYRTKTFEEYNLINYGALINGCKGFIVDGDENRKFPAPDNPGSMGVGDNTKLDATHDIYSNDVGDDYINEIPNTWNANSIANLPLLSASMQIPSDRIYIGTKSIRDALFQLNTYIRANDDLLMKLDLAASMSKGYRTLYVQDEAKYGTDTLINHFLNYDKTKSYSERLLQKSPTDTVLVEPYDSTFFNMTILKEDGIPLDSVFYIGIQNRRTDPLIYYTNPSDTSQKYMRFLSSAEFRDSCMNSPDSLLYQSYWWKRIGARRITIPFDYTYSDTNEYKLLRVTEIGYDDVSLNSLWHRGPKYYDMVNTVIGQDRSLSIDLLPGQGKILKVEVLKPGIVEGFLDNYNQANFVGFPDPLDSESIIYHLVFYKNSPKPNDSAKVIKEVEYIQSYPIKKNSSNINIIWNESSRKHISKDYLLSLNPVHPKYQDCDHPAIVVRNDTSGHPQAYIVYTCRDSIASTNDSARVVEAKVDVMSNITKSNQEIFKLSSNNMERYGTPVINASALGNFIAWSDETRGLLIAFQAKKDNVPTVIDSITNGDFTPLEQSEILYPSLNTYSHLGHNENNAGLVFYQNTATEKGVCYTRLSYDSTLGKITKSLPTFYGSNKFQFSLNYEFVRLALTSMETKPIIYRSLIDYNDSTLAWCYPNRYDNISWIDTLVGSKTNTIKEITLLLHDEHNIPTHWASSAINTIRFDKFGDTVKIGSINSAQQDGIFVDGTSQMVAGDYNLNFTIDDLEIYQKPGYNESLNFSRNLYSGYTINYEKNKLRKAATGYEVQLAKTPGPNFYSEGQIWKNRRVFQNFNADSLGNPGIESSAKLFFKTYNNEIVNHGYFGFSGDSNNVYFDLPKAEGDMNSISSFPIEIGIGGPDYIDPCKFLTTDLVQESYLTSIFPLPDFDNDGDREMQISMYGHKNNNIKIYLERVIDSTFTLLTMPPTSPFPFAGTKLIYSILDSTNSEFRLKYVKDDSTSFFSELSFINGMENADTISYKSAIEKDPVKYIIDFNNGGSQYVANHTNAIELKVYPNPTTGLVKVQAILPEEIDNYKLKNRDVSISIYNATGKLIVSKNGVSGQIFNFDLQNNPTGAYIIDAEYNDDTHPLKATENLVKQ